MIKLYNLNPSKKIKSNLTRDDSRFLKFCLVGLIGIFLNQTLLWFFTTKIGIYYLISSAIAIEITILNNFILNYTWTFKDKNINGCFLKKIIKYNIVSYSVDFLNIIILFILVSLLGIHYLVSNLIGIFSVVILKYILHIKWTWHIPIDKKIEHYPLKNPLVSLVIPTYNEKENIEMLLNSIITVFKENNIKEEIIIVDDNSPDKTALIVKKLQKKYKNIKLIKRKGKLGLSSAVIEGFGIAKGDILGVMDADLSHPPQKIPELLKLICDGKSDICIGSRYIDGGNIKNWPLKRKLISKGAKTLAKPLTNVKDPVSGFFFMKKDVIINTTLNPKGFKILLEILVKGKYTTIKEIPFIFVDRKEGKSKMTTKEIYNYINDLSSLYIFTILNTFKSYRND